jgi:hypothetical protein
MRLMPGMEVTAEIKTGERRLIEYFSATAAPGSGEFA